MTTITVNTPTPTAAPRGAQWAAQAFAFVADWLTYASARHSAQKSARQTQNLRAVEARRVRTYAQSVVNHDPRYAADLMAAADRHEAGI
jgi:hypothetical protein